MKAIIIGAGKIGFNIAQTLSQEGHDVYVVEKDEDKTVLEHLEEQKAGTNAVLSYQTFDTRA